LVLCEDSSAKKTSLQFMRQYAQGRFEDTGSSINIFYQTQPFLLDIDGDLMTDFVYSDPDGALKVAV